MSGYPPYERRDGPTLPPLSSVFGHAAAGPQQRYAPNGYSSGSYNSPFALPRPMSPRIGSILNPSNTTPHPDLQRQQQAYRPSNPFQARPLTASGPAPPASRDLPPVENLNISRPGATSAWPSPNSISSPPNVTHSFTHHSNRQPLTNGHSYTNGHISSSGHSSHSSHSISNGHLSIASTNSDSSAHVRGPTDSMELHSNRSSGVQSNRSSAGATSITETGSQRSSKASSKILGIKDVPGEGECYMLEDGSHMRTSIGGEPVNPAWGITKAGKPRKRLAKACMTCREKKIKCEQGEPGDSRCGQCARLNRVCKIAPSDSRSSPDAESMDRKLQLPAFSEERAADHGLQDNSLRKRRLGPLTGSPPLPRANGAGAPPSHRPMDITIPPLPTDRGRPQYYQDLHPPRDETSPPVIRKKGKQPAHKRPFRGPKQPRKIDTNIYDANVDPYVADPELTVYFLELFFYYRNKGPYAAIPRTQFMNWVAGTRNKTQDDLMAMYAMMALGSCFSMSKSFRDAGKPIFDIAYQLERQLSGNATLQLVHTRSAFVLYHFASGEFQPALENTNNAVRAAQTLRYQNESSITQVPENALVHEYGMNTNQLKECRRRSFWVVYLFDRYNSFSYGSMGSIHDVEVFLRLPCRDHQFVEGLDIPTPHFHGDSIREAYSERPGSMALLVDIVSVWGDITGFAYRAIQRSPVVYAEYYQKYFNETVGRMRDWVATLPEDLKFSIPNARKALDGGYFAKFYILHALYFLVGMKLGRTARIALLDDGTKRRNLAVARYHARKMLSLVSVLSKALFSYHGEDLDFALCQPFPGYAILNACDILSAGDTAKALASMTNNELEESKAVVEQVSNFWIINKTQQGLIDDRQGQLSAHGMDSGHERSRIRIKEAIDRSFLPGDHDMVYGVSDEIYFDVIENEGIDPPDPLGVL